jgi:voltage-gated potassium channel
LKNYQFKASHLLFVALFSGLLMAIVILERQNPDANIHSFWDALWYSIVTLTTVGYGDNYPITTGGKVIGIFFILSSLGLLGFLIGQATNIIQNYMEKKKEGHFGTSFKDHFVIIGWNNFGKLVAEQIVLAGNKLAIITENKADLDVIHKLFTDEQVFALFTDLNNYSDYNKVNINEARSAFVNLGDDSQALVFVINMKKHFEAVDYIISLQNAELRDTFQAVGVKHVLGKNEIASKLVASYIFEPDVASYTEDLIATSVDENDFDMQQYRVIANNPFIGVNYLDAFVNLKKDYDCILLGLSKAIDGTHKLLKNPGKSVHIEKNDFMILISNGETKRKIEDTFQIGEGFYR